LRRILCVNNTTLYDNLTTPQKNFMASTTNPAGELSIADLQRHIRHMYFDKDVARGVDGTFMWLMEEIGELASALRGNDKENLAEEFADVIAWLATIANVAEVDLNAALLAKYGQGCPGCGRLECVCPDSEKP
jgi:NTP pyrophosphatase (non-canonical NTP hydrolase)